MTNVETKRANVAMVERKTTQLAAMFNVKAQENLFHSICVQQASSGRSIEEVAGRLDITTDELSDVLRGHRDLTLTELRLLAVACDVVVSYSVEASTPRWWSALSLKKVPNYLPRDEASWQRKPSMEQIPLYVEAIGT